MLADFPKIKTQQNGKKNNNNSKGDLFPNIFRCLGANEKNLPT